MADALVYVSEHSDGTRFVDTLAADYPNRDLVAISRMMTREDKHGAVARWNAYPGDMECVTIPLCEVTPERRESYGITHEGTVRHTVTGPGLHNRNHPHRVQVWDNTGRPNPHPGEIRWTEYGSIGGPGQYLDPSNKGTDDPITVYLNAESIGIYAVYTPADRARASEGEPLRVGQRVRLLYPDGTLTEPYEITTRPLADPRLVPVQ